MESVETTPKKKTNADRQREYRERNSEVARQRQKEWYMKNRTRLLEQKAEKRIANKEKILEEREKEKLAKFFSLEELRGLVQAKLGTAQ